MEEQAVFTNVNPVNLFVASGIVQGFILCIVLFFRRNNQLTANRLLAITLFLINLHLANLLSIDFGHFPQLFWIRTSFLTAVGPLFYLYTQSKSDVNFTLSPKYIVHFIPVFFEQILHLIQVTYCTRHDILYYNSSLYLPFSFLIYSATGISIYYYLRISLRLIRRYEVWVRENFSNLREITLAWLYKLLAYYRWLWIGWASFVLLLLFTFQFRIQPFAIDIILYALITAVTYLSYWIGLENLIRTNVLPVPYQVQSSVAVNNYANVPKPKIEKYIAKIERLMICDKLFLNENLSLRKLAQEVEADPNLVSYILNEHMGKSFYEYVNHYRVEEVKSKLNDPAYADYTIVAIAYESGFNSKATFNRVFKKMEGVSPSDFKSRSREQL